MTGKTPLGGYPWIPILVAQSIVVLASGAVDSGGPRTGGIAARYPGDSGIARDPDVIFADDFESWREKGARPPDATWRVRTNRTSRTRAIPGTDTIDGVRGANVLEIACWTEGRGSQVGGLSRKLGNYNHAGEGLGNGHEEVYVRYHIKFDENYRAVRNHGANLGGGTGS